MTEKESLSSALTKIDKKSKFIIFFVGALVLLLALVGVKEISTTRSWLYPPTWLAVITGLVTLWRFCKKQKENPFANIFRTLKDDYVLDKYVTIQLFSIFYAFGQGAGIGGGGGFANNGSSGDAPLGSGGGSSGEAGDPGSSGPQGNNGGTSGDVAGGGGGGAGGAGAAGSTNGGGHGGDGVQLPPTFRSPELNPTSNLERVAGTIGAPAGPNGNYWVCGGGGGGKYNSNDSGGPGGNSPTANIRYSGGGNATYGPGHSNYAPALYRDGMAGTGGGGAGISPNFSGGPQTDPTGAGGSGGSGVVLIAYPIA